jgi:hypothetical protein
VREERKALRDTAKKIEKKSLGRHIYDRGHITESTTNTETNETHHRQDLRGLTESDVDKFKSDWRNATANFSGWRSLENSGQTQQAIKDSKPKSTEA